MAKSRRIMKYFRPVSVFLGLVLLLMGAGVGLLLAHAGGDPTWTQTTFHDFFDDSFKSNILVIDVGEGEGDVKLAYQTTEGVMNWPDPVELPAPGSKKGIYGSHWDAQTFTSDVSGNVVSLILFLDKSGSPGNLVVELRDCTTNVPETALPGTFLASTTILSTDVTEAGGAYEVEFSVTPLIEDGTMYSIVSHQESGAGDSQNSYNWYYDDTPGYGSGQAWKSVDSGDSWTGHGFGSHDFTLIISTPGVGYYSSGYLISSPHDTACSSNFGTISWSADTPPDTSVEFQIRSASTEAGLASATWYGPTGPSDFYTDDSGQAINLVHDGDQWVQYKAYLSGDTNETPVLHSVTISYEGAVDHIVIAPDGATINAGESIAFTATAYDVCGNSWDVTAGTSFDIEPEAGGWWDPHNVYHSEKAGTWTVTGTYEGVSDTTNLTVNAGEADWVELSPPSDSNTIGTEHVLTATVYDQFDNVVPDQAVDWAIIDGPGDFVETPDGATDANGQAHATISSNTVGTTTVRCSVSQDIYDEATKEWTNGDAARVELSPETASNTIGTEHVLTATVYDQFDNVVPDQEVEWAIVDGPGEFVSTETTTDINGETHATITSNTVGTTTVRCSVSQDIYDEATKEWTNGEAARVELSPPSDSNPVGSEHGLTATVYDEYDNVVPDQAIDWAIIDGPGDFVETPDGTTDANGQAHATIRSYTVGTTTVRCSVSQDIYDEATKEWTVGDAARVELLPETGSNPVGTEHVLTATAYDEYDNVVPDQELTWAIIDGPGDFVGTPDATTDGDGQAHATIRSYTVGTTTVRCSVSEDIYAEATKEWTNGEAARVELSPETASNQVGTEHDLTATVYDQFDNVVPGQTVEWAIVDGPGEFVSTETTTDINGETHATISSETVGTTTVKVSVSEDIYDTATKLWIVGGTGGGGGGGGGGGPVCTETFVVDFLGEITRGPMQPNGRLCEDLEAPCPDAMHLLEMRKNTRTVDSEGGVVRRIEITEATAPSLPPDTVLVGSAYEFSPSGITFDRSISLTLSYPVGELPADTLSVAMAYYSEGSGWTVVEAESSQVAEIGSLTSLIDHFSIFAIIAEVPPPELTVADLVVSPEEVSPEEDVTISVLVANTGGSTGSVSVVLRIEGEVEDTVEVILAPGASETITFSVTRDEADTYEVTVNGLSGSFTVTEAPFPWWAVGLGAGLGAFLLAAGASYVWVWRPKLMAA